MTGESNISLDESYPIVDGLQVKVGNLVFTNPTTYISAAVTNDANPDDGDLTLWGDGTLFGFADGYGSTFWDGGGAGDIRLVRDIEFRFTGVWSADSTRIVEGGSMATLGGVSGGSGERDIAAHPFKPAEVSDSTGAFLQRVPFEVWDVEDPDNPRQLNAVFYDRGADGVEGRRQRGLSPDVQHAGARLHHHRPHRLRPSQDPRVDRTKTPRGFTSFCRAVLRSGQRETS